MFLPYLLASERSCYGGKSEAAFGGGGEVEGPKVSAFTCEMVPIFSRLLKGRLLFAGVC